MLSDHRGQHVAETPNEVVLKYKTSIILKFVDRRAQQGGCESQISNFRS